MLLSRPARSALSVIPLLVVWAPTPAAAAWLVFTEIHYRPADETVPEFIELYLLDPPSVDLSGWRLDGAVDFTFPRGSTLAPGECVVVSADPESLALAHPGAPLVVGPFSGKLGSDGGRVRLLRPNGAIAAELRYGRDPPWSSIPDGTGYTLTLADPGFDPLEPASWIRSSTRGGSPGVLELPQGRSSARSGAVERRRRGSASETDSEAGVATTRDAARPTAQRAPLLSAVTFERQEAGASAGYRIASIELHNPGDEPLELDSWCLSDERAAPLRCPLAGAGSIPARSSIVLGTEVGAGVIAALRPLDEGATAWISIARTADRDIVDALRLSLPRGRPSGTLSLGRVPDALSANVAELAEHRPGTPNRPRVDGDLVLSEIHYHPTTSDADEFVEITNRGPEEVELRGYRLRGAIRYEFPSTAKIAPGGFVVVAKNPERVRRLHALDASVVHGPMEKSLGNGGEPLRIEFGGDAANPGTVIDEAHYGDRKPWPELADGGGSSLELVHPLIDNRFAAAWRASDETDRAEWREYRTTAVLDTSEHGSAMSVQLFLLDAGECLIDDVEIRDARGDPVLAESFDGGSARWSASGTHEESRVVDQGEFASNPCLLLRASGRGNPRRNYASCLLSSPLEQGERYTFSLRARWRGGSPLLLARTHGQGLAHTHRLDQPPAGGTPGRPNSRLDPTPAPIFGETEQSPIAPSSSESVEFRIPISSLAPITAAKVHFRHENAGEWREVALERDASRASVGTTSPWRVSIPPLPRGRVELWFETVDREGQRGTYPDDAPRRVAMYAVGIELHGTLPTYTILVSDREWNETQIRPSEANVLLDATVIYGTSRIVRHAGLRLRGSPFTRSARNWRVVFGEESIDGRSTLTLDGQGGEATNLAERLTFTLIDRLGAPVPRSRYVQVEMPGNDSENGTYEDVERIDGAFLDRWFPAPSAPPATKEGTSAKIGGALSSGRLHKIDDHWEIAPEGALNPFPSTERRRGRGSRRGRGDRSYSEAYFRYETDDPEDYRWNFTPRANGTVDDFEPLIELIQLLDPGVTSDEDFDAHAERMLDVDEWLRVLAARTVANDWDSIGLTRGKNAYVYRSPHDQRWYLLPWDADLSWQSGRNRGGQLISSKFPEIERLLLRPRFLRRFLSYVTFLTDRELAPESIGATLSELRQRTGAYTGEYEDFAAFTRERIADQLPNATLAVFSIERVPREGAPDLVRLRANAPLRTDHFRLAGKSTSSRIVDFRELEIEAAVGPDGGPMELEALDLAGTVVAKASIDVPPRSGAAILAELEPMVEASSFRRGVRVGGNADPAAKTRKTAMEPPRARTSERPSNDERSESAEPMESRRGPRADARVRAARANEQKNSVPMWIFIAPPVAGLLAVAAALIIQRGARSRVSD
jgi:hypothetical protein